jgi:galactose-6-phosphate isomerase
VPFIDVSDVITDPMVAGDEFIVIRRRATVNDHGEGEDAAPLRFQAVGSITPVGDNSLVREEAYETQTNAIQVITEFALRGAGVDKQGNEFQPDQVEWDGDTYTVRVVDNYSKFGAGFVRAECVTQSLASVYTTPE